MSSKPASSSNVQSTNHKKHEPVAKETSKDAHRPPSAQKTPVANAPAAGISPGASATGGNEAVVSPTLATTERPPSAQKHSEVAGAHEKRPGSGQKHPETAGANEHRPASAVKQTSNDALSSNAADPTVTPSLGDTNANASNLRPPSASAGSRPGSASQKQDNAATTVAPPGSRPGSAARKQGETTSGIATATQQDPSAVPIDLNNPNIAQPIIGRPASGMKKASTDDVFGGPTAAATMPSPADTPAAGTDAPPAKSATDNPPGQTTTDGTS